MRMYEKVKEACKEADISVITLESELGFARSSICKWDKNIPSIEKVALVARRLNKPLDYFVRENIEERNSR